MNVPSCGPAEVGSEAIDAAHNTKLAVRYRSAPRDIGQLALRLSSTLDMWSEFCLWCPVWNMTLHIVYTWLLYLVALCAILIAPSRLPL